MFLDPELSPEIGLNVSLAIYRIKIDSSRQLFTEKIFRLRSNDKSIGEKLQMLN